VLPSYHQAITHGSPQHPDHGFISLSSLQQQSNHAQINSSFITSSPYPICPNPSSSPNSLCQINHDSHHLQTHRNNQQSHQFQFTGPQSITTVKLHHHQPTKYKASPAIISHNKPKFTAQPSPSLPFARSTAVPVALTHEPSSSIPCPCSINGFPGQNFLCRGLSEHDHHGITSFPEQLCSST
jgi:hypothetical protein